TMSTTHPEFIPAPDHVVCEGWVGALLPTWRQRSAAIAGAAVAATTGLDGAQPWPVARALLVILTTGGALLVGQRIGGRRQAAIWTALGFAATLAGAGIGVPYLIHTGMSAITVAGLTALIAGIVTIVAGMMQLLADTRWWHKLLLGVSTVA